MGGRMHQEHDNQPKPRPFVHRDAREDRIGHNRVCSQRENIDHEVFLRIHSHSAS